MIVVGAGAACLLIFVAGFGTALLILKNSSGINLLECFCLAWPFGVGITSLSLWIVGGFSSDLFLQTIVSAICLALALAGWRSSQRARNQLRLPLPRTTAEWVLAVIVGLEIATIVVVSFKHTLGWDGLLNWEIKARYAFFNHGVLPASYYSGGGRAFSHPEYPLAIPFAELWLYLWMGEPNQLLVKIIFPLFYAGGALLLALFVARLTGKRWMGLLIAALLPFVPFVTAGAGGVVVGYVDFPLGIVYLAATGYLLQFLKDRHGSALYPFSICAALLPWIKSEGVILYLILVIGICALSSWKKIPKSSLISLAPGLALILTWKLYLKIIHAIPPSDFARPSITLLREHMDRVGRISSILWAEVIDLSDWSIFWLLAGVAVLYLLFSRRTQYIALALAVVTPIILYWLTYLFSAWPSYMSHMTSSMPRLLFQVVPVAWLAIGIAAALPKDRSE